ncbi:hypothetical protein Pcinc_024033 [Petrolisthes cinctipes]|uniref:Uncharacterized protein n=1 Tax=Petrolisthes cinctipes TaxID=88211 RepID=A0AAE1KFX9_PETCI|nr:hypothetical protein Pcinc_024033 [Petrolisthes cinctipes]
MLIHVFDLVVPVLAYLTEERDATASAIISTQSVRDGVTSEGISMTPVEAVFVGQAPGGGLELVGYLYPALVMTTVHIATKGPGGTRLSPTLAAAADSGGVVERYGTSAIGRRGGTRRGSKRDRQEKRENKTCKVNDSAGEYEATGGKREGKLRRDDGHHALGIVREFSEAANWPLERQGDDEERLIVGSQLSPKMSESEYHGREGLEDLRCDNKDGK